MVPFSRPETGKGQGSDPTIRNTDFVLAMASPVEDHPPVFSNNPFEGEKHPQYAAAASNRPPVPRTLITLTCNNTGTNHVLDAQKAA
jgi:hypothetical protein